MSIFNGRYQLKPHEGDTTSRDRVIRDVDQGKKGKVLRTIPHKRQVVVQNINYVWKHLRRSQQNPQGGRIHKEAPLPIAKVMLVCKSCNEPARVYRKRKDEKGEKITGGTRFCKKCDAAIATT